ncbi:MAG: hypothetical protein AAFN77_22665 [Planctomycetota bacterium]
MSHREEGLDPDQFDRFDMHYVYAPSFVKKGIELCSSMNENSSLDFDNTDGLALLSNGGVFVTKKPGFAAVESSIGRAVRLHVVEKSMQSDYKEGQRTGGGAIRQQPLLDAEVVCVCTYNDNLANASRDYSGIRFDLEDLVDFADRTEVEISFARTRVKLEESQIEKCCQEQPESNWEIKKQTSSRLTGNHSGFDSRVHFYTELTSLIDWATCFGVIKRFAMRHY